MLYEYSLFTRLDFSYKSHLTFCSSSAIFGCLVNFHTKFVFSRTIFMRWNIPTTRVVLATSSSSRWYNADEHNQDRSHDSRVFRGIFWA